VDEQQFRVAFDALVAQALNGSMSGDRLEVVICEAVSNTTLGLVLKERLDKLGRSQGVAKLS